MSEKSDMSTVHELSNQLLAAIESGAMEEVENRWIDLLEDPPTSSEFYHQFIRAMRRAKQLERAHELILLALDELEARSAWQAKLDLLRLAAKFWPDSKALRPHTARALKQVYAQIPQLSDMIAACKGLPLDQVFARFDDFLRMLPGEVYSHPYWGVGIIRKLDIQADRVVLEFPDSEEPRRELALDFLLKHLRHCPPTSFTARLITDPASLRDFAQTDPVGFIKLVLEDCEGRVKPSELKELVVGPLFSDAEWTRWWANARTQLKLDPWIDFDASRGARAEIALRAQPRTFEDEILETYFDPAATLATRTDCVRQIARMLESDANVAADLIAKISDDLAKRIRSADSAPAERLAALYLLELLASKAPERVGLPSDLPSEDVLLEPVKDYSALRDLPELSFAQRALRKLVARDGESGIEQAAAIFPEAPAVLAQAIWSVLQPEEHVGLAVRALRTLFEKPLSNPETFLWAARQLTERKWAHLEDYVPLAAFTMDLLELLNELDALTQRMGTLPEQAEKAKWLLGRVRSLITAGDFQLLAHIVQDMTREQVQELRRAIQLHNVFNEAARLAADRAIRLVRRDLDEQATSLSQGPSTTGGGAFLCTLKGRARAAAELHELNTVTIPENAKEIEKARSEGDLRENAGYHGARERHAHLLRRAHFLQEGLARAQVVRREDVNTETVSFGTRVILTNLDTGAQQTYTILGQWESAPERGIYDYKAPFLTQMLGKKVGEEFIAQTLDGQRSRYRVDAIENALASGEWDTENV